MKRQYIILFFVFIVISSCSIYKRIFSVVSNKFPLINSSVPENFKTWNDSNLYILRVQLENKNKVTYVKNRDSITELTDYPLKDYKLLTQPEWKNQQIVEEVYLYLSEFQTKANDSGKVLYMSTMPLKPKVSELMYCNNYFISTYGINHIMDGIWTRNGDNIVLKLADKKNELRLEGEYIENFNDTLIEFTIVSHPKPMNKNDKSLIEISDVFEVDPNNESRTDNRVSGIRFFQNANERAFVHPDWDKLGERFDSTVTANYYLTNKEKRKITKVMIGGDDKYRVFFKLNDSTLNSSQNIIGYKR